AMEERETRLKATGFFRTLGAAEPAMGAAELARAAGGTAKASVSVEREPAGAGAKLLLVDNDDCFIHTLANYARQTGADVVTYRAGVPPEMIDQIAPDLILISPGPGRPADFGVPGVVKHAAERGFPVF